MISRNDKGFFAAHWDWLVAGLGVLVLAGGAAVLCIEPTTDEEGFGDAEMRRYQLGAAGGPLTDDWLLAQWYHFSEARGLDRSPVWRVSPATEDATLRLAAPGDTVLIAGRGHERRQLIGDRAIGLNDMETVRALFARAGSTEET